MTTHDAMLRTIIENPDDDFPRLCYADWLEENGEVDRSSFIRVQVELSRLSDHDISESPVNPDHRLIDSRKSELRRRERELRDSHEREWLPDPAMLEIVRVGVGGRLRIQREWHRGFISSLTCDWQTFRRVADVLIWTPREVGCHCRANVPTGLLAKQWMIGCSECSGTGLVPRPFPATCQPIERVTLTTWPDVVGPYTPTTGDNFDTPQGRFTRVKCPTCDDGTVVRHYGSIGSPPEQEPCPDCHGTPPNTWHCDKYPGIVFVMPEAERQRDAAIDWSIPPEALGAGPANYNYAAAQAAYDAHRRG